MWKEIFIFVIVLVLILFIFKSCICSCMNQRSVLLKEFKHFSSSLVCNGNAVSVDDGDLVVVSMKWWWSIIPNYVYFIRGENGSYVMIDTGDIVEEDYLKLEKVIRTLKMEIEYIIITHSHFDHIGNTRKLKELTKGKIIISDYENQNLSNGGGSESYPLFFHHSILFGFLTTYVWELFASPDIGVNGDFLYSLEQDKLEDQKVEDHLLQNYSIELLLTPGHTEGTISVFNKRRKEIFVSDCIGPWIDTCFGGGLRGWGYHFYMLNLKEMNKSYQKIADLGAEKIFSSHIHGFVTLDMFVRKFSLKK